MARPRSGRGHLAPGADVGSRRAARARLTPDEARALKGIDFERAAKEARRANREAARESLPPLPPDASKAERVAREKLVGRMRAPGLFRERAAREQERVILSRGLPRTRAARANLARAAGMRAYWAEVKRFQSATGKSLRDSRVLARISKNPAKAAALGKLGEAFRSPKRKGKR